MYRKNIIVLGICAIMTSCMTGKWSEKELTELPWTKTYARSSPSDRGYPYESSQQFFYDEGYKGFYPVDTLYMDDYIFLKYKDMEFVVPERLLLKNINNLNYDFLFDKNVFISGFPLVFGINTYAYIFDEKDWLDYDEYEKKFFPSNGYILKKLSKDVKIYKTKNKPKYFLVGLLEWGYFCDQNKDLCFWVKKKRNKTVPKELNKYLGGYVRVAFPIFD